MSVRIQSAFVADADAATVPRAAMGAHIQQAPVLGHAAVSADVEMIAGAVESVSAVCGFQRLSAKGTVFARGAAMYHNQVDVSHSFFVFCRPPVRLRLSVRLCLPVRLRLPGHRQAERGGRLVKMANCFVWRGR